MVKKIFIIILCLLISSPAFAVSFYGIQSGMSCQEMADLFRLTCKEIEESSFGIFGDKLKGYDKMLGKKISSITPSFTDKSQLWRLSIKFLVPLDQLKEIALEKALEVKYKEHKIEKVQESSSLGRIDYFYLIMIDEKLSNEAVIRYVEEYMNDI